MQRWLTALALSAALIPSVSFAGDLHARIEGPAPDGITYTARTYGGDETTRLEPWAYAEGVVDGKPQSWLLRLKPTNEPGVYQFKRVWPEEGTWMIRYMLGHPPAPATVATLRADGTVEKNRHYYRSNGGRECHRALKKLVKVEPGKPGEPGEGC
jgi:hypothetical protein